MLRPEQMPSFAAFVSLELDQLIVENALPAELAAISPKSIASRREQFMLGRQAAHEALKILGRDEQPILVGNDREPVWPEGIVGTIAHTIGHAVALVAPSESTDGVGVDVEVRRAAPELFNMVLRPEEVAWVDDLAPTRRNDAALGVFSAKECIYKAFFHRVGSYFSFEAARLTPTDVGFEARLVAPIDPDYPPSRKLSVHSQRQEELMLSWLVLPKT